MTSSNTNERKALMKRRSIRVSEMIDIIKRYCAQIIDGPLDGLNNLTKQDCLDWFRDYGICEYSGEEIGNQPYDFDHVIPNALLYEGDKVTWEIVLRKWHKVKTKADVKRIAKAKRQAGETGQYARRKRRDKPLIPSPTNYKWPSRPMQTKKNKFTPKVKVID